MRESTALEAGLTVEQWRARVEAQRAAQALPPTIEDATTLQRIADLMRSVEPPKRRRRARAS
jgi:hypothetical protein